MTPLSSGLASEARESSLMRENFLVKVVRACDLALWALDALSYPDLTLIAYDVGGRLSLTCNSYRFVKGTFRSHCIDSSRYMGTYTWLGSLICVSCVCETPAPTCSKTCQWFTITIFCARSAIHFAIRGGRGLSRGKIINILIPIFLCRKSPLLFVSVRFSESTADIFRRSILVYLLV